MRTIPTRAASGLLVGVVGILLSVVTIASHRAHTEAVIHRTESNDAWAYYQAKKIREYTSEVTVSLLQTLAPDPAKAEASVQKLNAARDKYASDAEKIREDANAQRRRDQEGRAPRAAFRHRRGISGIGPGALLPVLPRANGFFPIFGIISAVAGTAMGIWGYLL